MRDYNNGSINCHCGNKINLNSVYIETVEQSCITPGYKWGDSYITTCSKCDTRHNVNEALGLNEKGYTKNGRLWGEPDYTN